MSLRPLHLLMLIAAVSADAEEVFTGTINPGAEPVTFATFGDFGDRNSILPPAQVASMVKGWDVDFILAAGDLNYGSTLPGSPDWDARIGVRYGDWIVGRTDNRYPLQTAAVQRFFPVVGNHDTSVGGLGGGDVRGYVDYFVRNAPGGADRLPTGSGIHDDEVTYYDFTKGNVHFIMADSDRGRVDPVFAEEQNTWIANALRSSTSRWKFVVMHHPAWSSDGFHGNQTWMQGEHLAMADAVFAGHAHVYERIETAGTTFFTCGMGGRGFYPFRTTNLHPDSEFRFNSAHGAIRVTCTDTGALMEFVSNNDGAFGANGGVVTDSTIRGNYVPINNEGIHEIEVIAGQEVTSNISGDGVPFQLDVRDPDGTTIVERPFVAAVSGRYQFRISAGEGVSGSYDLAVDLSPDSPTTPVEVWRAQCFGFDAVSETAGDFEDPDRDGKMNLMEYALGTDPDVPNGGEDADALPRFFNDTTFFVLPLSEGLRDDITYSIEVSESLDAPEWTVVSTRAAESGTWMGSAPVVVSPKEGRAVDLRIAEVNSPSFRARRFYRLKVSR